MQTSDPLQPTESAVVQASAGTGKTWLLTSRLVRLLISGVSPGEIVALTFTRQAATEMQQRLRQRLLEMAAAPEPELDRMLLGLGLLPTDASRAACRGLYESVLTSISTLRIKTFHAFCQEILQRFPLEATVPPRFDLCEQTGEVEWAAWEALDQELMRDPKGEVAMAMDELLRSLGSLHMARSCLFAFLDHRSDWWAFTEDEPDPTAHAVARARRTLGITEDDTERALLTNAAIRADLGAYADLLDRNSTTTNIAIVAQIQSALSTNEHCDGFRQLRMALLTQERAPRQLRVGPTLIKRLGAADASRLEQLHAALADHVLATERVRLRQATLALSRAWYVCGARLLDHFQRLKREQSLLDFADLEWCAYRLLTQGRHAEWVQYKLDQRIDHLLIDEFQDTNPTQWRLLQPLLAEMTAGNPERNRSVFLVGDAKQSIYRFRRAEPQLFDAARDWLTASAGAGVTTQDASWRSSPAILRFVDLLFQHSDAAAPYALGDYRPHGVRHAKLWGMVELLPLVRRNRSTPTSVPALRNPLTTPRTIDEDERHYREGQLIAEKISELVGRPIGHDARPLCYGDIIILLRDRTHAPDYELALRKARIPYAGADRGNFVACLEIRDLIGLLTVLLVPDDDLALAGVLRSPLFDASHDDLQRLARAEVKGAWYDRLLALDALPSDTPLARAKRLLPRWREGVDRIPVHDLLDRIFCEGNVVARYDAAAPPHLKDRVTTQLNRLLVLALDADSGRFPSLARFIERLAQLTSEEYESSPAADAGNRVRMMTIHAAKGLEAPVVFLANAAQPGGGRDRGPRPLIEWLAHEPRPSVFHLVGPKDDLDDASAAILARIEAGNRREESNLLYVALTRAQQVLYISGCEPGRANGDQAQRRGWYGFIESRLEAAAKAGGANADGLHLSPIADTDGNLFNTCGRIEHGTPPSSSMSTPPVTNTAPAIDPALTRPFPITVSPASAIQPSRYAAFEPEGPTTTDGDPMLDTAARRGAIIHRALEQLSACARDQRAAVRARLWQEWMDQVNQGEFDEYWDEAVAVLEHPAFRDCFEANRYDRARNELPILYALNERDVYGVIDRLVWRGPEILLLDYKTHRITQAEITATAARFEPQLKLYAAGVRRLWPGAAVRPILIFTACRQSVELAV